MYRLIPSPKTSTPSSGSHPVSHSMGTKNKVQQLAHNADCSPPTGTEDENESSYTSVPSITVHVNTPLSTAFRGSSRS